MVQWLSCATSLRADISGEDAALPFTAYWQIQMWCFLLCSSSSAPHITHKIKTVCREGCGEGGSEVFPWQISATKRMY